MNPLGAAAHDPKKREQRRIISGALRADLENNPEYVAELVGVIKKSAKQGRAWAIDMIFDRLEGKAIQAIEMEQVSPFSHLSDEELKQKLIEVSGKIG